MGLYKEYTSPDIVNEIITIMGKTILQNLLSRIKSSLWFSIIADEATDISLNQQCHRQSDGLMMTTVSMRNA